MGKHSDTNHPDSKATAGDVWTNGDTRESFVVKSVKDGKVKLEGENGDKTVSTSELNDEYRLDGAPLGRVVGSRIPADAEVPQSHR
jgi:hypothetical protein